MLDGDVSKLFQIFHFCFSLRGRQGPIYSNEELELRKVAGLCLSPSNKMNCMKTSLFGFSTSLHLRDRQEGFLPNIGNWEQKFLACFLEASILSNPCINFVLLLFLFSYFVVFFPTSFNHCLILLLSKIHMIRNLSKEKPTFVKVESHLSLNRFFCTTLNELC